MKIEVHSEDLNLKIKVPLYLFPARILIKEMLDDVDEDCMPSKKEMKQVAKEAVKILKEHKGLVIVDMESDDGETVKITI